MKRMVLCAVLALLISPASASAPPTPDAPTNGDLAKVKALIGNYASLMNSRDREAATSSHHAVAPNHEGVVHYLPSEKADVSAKKKDGVTSLRVAASLGRTEHTELSVAKGADASADDWKGQTPLSLARDRANDATRNIPLYEGKVGTKIGDMCVNPKDSAVMVWVPAGEFLMGSTDVEISAVLRADPRLDEVKELFDDEKPQRIVYLDGYWMYKYEVTVAQYRSFCKATSRRIPETPGWGWYDSYPMVNVSWQDAVDYTSWAAVSLPTEAQWEKAARGTDGRTYTWGREWDASKCANSVKKGLKSPRAVGSYASDVSPYGCMDLAGNVREWCADWYDPKYYSDAPSKNPRGPSNAAAFKVGRFTFQSARVFRGGCWVNDYYASFREFRCSSRCILPAEPNKTLGFRCALAP